ncbi:dihydrolipoamide acetyltransferase family protein [Streptomyces sp. NPDC051018]|uniref:dihydrolipoamide acetyltransferase family protein n=1 Tax=Streptomyces sp. NPDC051018 TaxID=3365639 RepID=UPI0037AAA95A
MAENVPFKAGDPIVVIETDKAVVEVEAETDGVILRALVAGGTEVEIGAPMAVVGVAGETGAEVDALLGGPVSAGTGTASVPGGTASTPAGTASAPGTVTATAPVHASPEPPPAERVFSSPLARRLLREAGVSTGDVTGTGPHGRIVRRDAERAIEAVRGRAPGPSPATIPAGTPAPPAPAVPVPVSGPPVRTDADGAPYEEVPHSRLRRAIATRLTASKQTVPHFYLKRTARIDELLALRRRLNEVSPQKISVNDLVVLAVAAAHTGVPEANVIWTETGMRRYASVDIAVAIASGRGLVTPVLRSVERSSPSAVAREIRAYAEQADEGRLQQRDLEGGSITVTNLGMYGVEEFSAIINPPHSAVLAVGAGRQEPVVTDGTVEVATRLTLVLAADHRAIDGALAARWMTALVRALEEPLRLVT